jgi:5-methylcytosine-specific restriction endonuclease McrA
MDRLPADIWNPALPIWQELIGYNPELKQMLKRAYQDACEYEDTLPIVNYQEYIASARWKRRARDTKERVGYRCQLCGKCGTDATLNTHHNNYERLGDELDTDLIVLCKDCHGKYHDKVAAWIPLTKF